MGAFFFDNISCQHADTTLSAGLRYSPGMESKLRASVTAMIVGFLLATCIAVGAADRSSREIAVWSPK